MEIIQLGMVLKVQCALAPGQRVVVGFSGGADSLALLHILHRLGQPLIAAHFDHSLRPESAAEAEWAKELAGTLGVPFVTERGEVGAFAGQHHLSIEEAARQLRYEFLFRAAREGGAAAVAVAHNADDQAETVLMHLLRGAGPAGLSGMQMRSLPNSWSDKIPLLRPLLNTWREEIEAYCAENKLQPIQDPSNQETTFFRNRLRHEVLPLLERTVPGAKRRLAQTADLLAADQELIAQLAQGAWRRCLGDRGADYLRLDRRALLAEPLALQRAVLRRAVIELRPAQRDVDYTAVQRGVDALAAGGPATPVDWMAGLCLLAEGPHLWMAGWEAELPVDWPRAPQRAVTLQPPAELTLDGGWRLQAEVTQAPDPANLTHADPFQVWLDLERVGQELSLRRRRPGDRFQPLGMEDGSTKLADFFINAKLPQRARDGWPLLCKGEQIAWVPGYQLAHPFRLQPGSRQALHLQLRR